MIATLATALLIQAVEPPIRYSHFGLTAGLVQRYKALITDIESPVVFDVIEPPVLLDGHFQMEVSVTWPPDRVGTKTLTLGEDGPGRGDAPGTQIVLRDAEHLQGELMGLVTWKDAPETSIDFFGRPSAESPFDGSLWAAFKPGPSGTAYLDEWQTAPYATIVKSVDWTDPVTALVASTMVLRYRPTDPNEVRVDEADSEKAIYRDLTRLAPGLRGEARAVVEIALLRLFPSTGRDAGSRSPEENNAQLIAHVSQAMGSLAALDDLSFFAGRFVSTNVLAGGRTYPISTGYDTAFADRQRIRDVAVVSRLIEHLGRHDVENLHRLILPHLGLDVPSKRHLLRRVLTDAAYGTSSLEVIAYLQRTAPEELRHRPDSARTAYEHWLDVLSHPSD